MQASCDVDIRRLPGTVVLAVRGELGGQVRTALDEVYLRAVAEGEPRLVVLDFSATTYINSTGIALIVGLLGRARAEGRNVAAVGLTEHYRQIFEITRLADFIEVCADLDEALRAGTPDLAEHSS